MEFFGSDHLRSSSTDFSSGQEPPSRIRCDGAGNKEQENESLFTYVGTRSTYIAQKRRHPLYLVGWGAPLFFGAAMLRRRRIKPDHLVAPAGLVGIHAISAALSSWLFGSYVYRLRWHPGSDEFEVDMMSGLGMYTTRTIKLADVRPPQDRNFLLNEHIKCEATSFLANGKHYTIERDHFQNKELLAMLTPTDQVSSESKTRNY